MTGLVTKIRHAYLQKGTNHGRRKQVCELGPCAGVAFGLIAAARPSMRSGARNHRA